MHKANQTNLLELFILHKCPRKILCYDPCGQLTCLSVCLPACLTRKTKPIQQTQANSNLTAPHLTHENHGSTNNHRPPRPRHPQILHPLPNPRHNQRRPHPTHSFPNSRQSICNAHTRPRPQHHIHVSRRNNQLNRSLGGR